MMNGQRAKQENDLTHYMTACQLLMAENKALKEQLAKFVPVQLEVLTNEEILEALPSWGVIYQDKVITSRDKLVSEATIAKNSKKQLYRRIE